MAVADQKSSTYRGRLAPSPTGLLHIGHASTFLTAYTRAQQEGGVLVFRNEDLDTQRSRREFVSAMVKDLHWLGIDWQEGDDVGGPCGPYSQSQRREHYQAAWRALFDRGYLYPCRCSRKDLAAMTSAPHEGEDSEGPNYPGTCRPPTNVEHDHYDDPADLNWRFRVPDGQTIFFEDQHFGPQRFTAGLDFGDFLIWRRDGVPSYQLACVADDAAMHITEVVRGEDLLKSTARQILLYQALGWQTPLWFHCPLKRDAQGQRLAKRHDALSIKAMREQGHSPEDLRKLLLQPS